MAYSNIIRFLAIVTIIINLGISIASIIVVAQGEDTTCKDDRPIKLNMWLLVYGVVNICAFVMGLIVCILSVILEKYSMIFRVSWLVMMVFWLLWNGIWSVIGIATIVISANCLSSFITVWVTGLLGVIVEIASICTTMIILKHIDKLGYFVGNQFVYEQV